MKPWCRTMGTFIGRQRYPGGTAVKTTFSLSPVLRGEGGGEDGIRGGRPGHFLLPPGPPRRQVERVVLPLGSPPLAPPLELPGDRRERRNVVVAVPVALYHPERDTQRVGRVGVIVLAAQ